MLVLQIGRFLNLMTRPCSNSVMVTTLMTMFISYHSFCVCSWLLFDTLGSNSVSIVGRRVRVLLLKSICAGLEARPWLGVLRWSSRANYGSCPTVAAVCMRRLTVLTADFAFPLLCEYPGEDVLCSNSHFWLNFLKSCDEYCGPLSEKSTSGIPWSKVCFQFVDHCGTLGVQ